MLKRCPIFRFFRSPFLHPFLQAIEAVSEVNDLETLWSSLKDQPGGFGRFSKWLVDNLDSYGMLWIKSTSQSDLFNGLVLGKLTPESPI
jgi:hypothetical protein